MAGHDRDEPTQHKFKIHMYDFSCEDLPMRYEKPEFFLKINFDGFKVFKTDLEKDTSCPEWSFKAGFVYVMAYLEKLKQHNLSIQCFDRRSDTPVGQAVVDLQTVACGPVHFKLSLKGSNSSESQGFVKFTCIMKMMSQDFKVWLKEMKLTMMGTPGAARMDVTTSLDEDQSKTCPHSAQGIYPGPWILELDTSLCDLLKAPQYEYVHFIIIDEHGIKQGEAQLTFRNTFEPGPAEWMPFSVDVCYHHAGGGEEEPEDLGRVGELEGSILYQNTPALAQMIGGLCTDGQIDGGSMLAKGLPYPSCMEDPPEVWQDPSDPRNFLENLLGDPNEPDEENEPNLDDLDDETFYAALEQVDLPPPWEKRRERAGERPGARMYFVDPRSRRTTYKDPRFVPENWDQRIDANTGKVYFHFHKVKGNTYIDPRGCPKEWEMRLSKDGDVYFAYMPAARTTWTDPRGLPENIEAGLDDKGRMYFKNHQEKNTTWEDPRHDQQEVLLTQWRNTQMARWLREQVFSELEEKRQRMDEDEEDPEHAEKEK